MKAGRGKQRNDQHLIDEEGSALLAACLPRHWVLHPYRPDYGIDFSLETFSEVPSGNRRSKKFETLGEHLFIQLKSSRSVRIRSLKIYGRYNVEKRPETIDKTQAMGTIPVAKHQLDSTELVTVERMGVGVPVLLAIADLSARRCYFVCLNDYIDKILVPGHSLHGAESSRVIRVPVSNAIDEKRSGHVAIRWYAKRAKLFAAFQRFVYQNGILENETSAGTIVKLAQYFAERIMRYDFWDDTEMWAAVHRYASAIRQFLKNGDASALRLESGLTPYEQKRLKKPHRQQDALDVLRLWKLLSLLPGNYEDVCREWFLPTAIGYLTSYYGRIGQDSVSDLYSKVVTEAAVDPVPARRAHWRKSSN